MDVYTLEVTPEEGEKLALASNEGKLQFALRNVTDSETVLTAGATVGDTLESYRSRGPAKLAEAKPQASARAFYVEIIRGTDRENAKF